MNVFGKGNNSKPHPMSDMDLEDLVDRLTPGEIKKLLEECDPDDSSMPPSMRNNYKCDKPSTGALDTQKLQNYIRDQALNTPDIPDIVPYIPNTTRGKKWIAPIKSQKHKALEDKIELGIDIGEEYEVALNSATTEEIIDLAGVLGLHSMMNQDQFHSAQSDKWANKPDPSLGWNGKTKATPLKIFPNEAPNTTNVLDVINSLRNGDSSQTFINLNNVPIVEDQFIEIFELLENNNYLKELSMANTQLGDVPINSLTVALEKNNCLEKLNIESNNVSPITLTKIFEAIIKNQTIKEIKASNQRSQFLGNKVETALTKAIEKNSTILKVGLHFEFGDCRNRVAVQLQKNLDAVRIKRTNKNHQK